MNDIPDINDDSQYDIDWDVKPDLAQRLIEFVRDDFRNEVSESLIHEGRQSIIKELYTHWANLSYRSDADLTSDDIAAIKAHSESLTPLQRTDVAISVLNELFGGLDHFKEKHG